MASKGICLFKAVTGVPCPLCGGTTATGLLLVRGDLPGAWGTQPLVVVIGLGLALLHSLLLLIELLRRRVLVPRQWWIWPWSWWAMAALLWWCWRLTTG